MIAINLSDIEPIAYCIVIREILDSDRFLKGFCDNVTMKYQIKEVEEVIRKIKRELLNNIENQKHFIGIKTLILDLLDRILALSNRYSSINIELTSEVQKSIKSLIKKVAFSSDFNDLKNLSEEFNREVYLKMYKLFIEYINLKSK
ncbi:MAG: hypothetical protein QXP34_00810 [Candidatus Aenigmatarchaeota archaeon]